MKKIFVFVLCAFLCVWLLGCGKANQVVSSTTSESISSTISSDVSSTTGDTLSQVSSSVSSQSSVSTGVSSATSSTVSTVKPAVTESIVIKELGLDAYNNIMKFSASGRSWGQGLEFDSKNRPIYALNAQNSYGKYGGRYIMDDEMKIYLTFDLGYEYNNNTAKMLDVLKEKNVKAVFFVTGGYVKSRPDLVKRIIDEGHIVGNHSWGHPDYTTKTLEQAYEDIKKLHDYMESEFDYTMTLFRFPSGVCSDRLLVLVKEMGYESLFWSFAYADWDTSKQPNEQDSLELILKRAHPGAIPLLHSVSNTNTNILADVIDGFREKGYELCAYPVN